MNPTSLKTKNKSPGKRPRSWRRFFLRALVVLVVAVIGFAITAPYIVGWIIGRQLQSQLSTRMNAKLEYARVVYHYPFSVKIEKAHLLMPGGKSAVDSWLDIGRLELTLAKLPLGAGPLLIQKLEIENPVVHLASNFGTDTSAAPSPPVASAPAATPTQKLSDLFQLQNVAITNGRFEYDLSLPGHVLPPVVWGHLNANMNTLPAAGGTYKFNVAVADQPLAIANATGSFDIDSLQLNLEKLNMVMACDPNQKSEQIPPEGLAIIQKYQIAGQVSIDASGTLPISAMDQTSYTANITLKNGHCLPPGWAGPIAPSQVTLTGSKAAGASPCKVDIDASDDHGTVVASGSVDLKTLLLDLPRLSVKVKVDPAHPVQQMPADVARMIADLKTGGEMTLDGSARLPLLSPLKGWYIARMSLSDGQCQLAGWKGPVSPAKFLLLSSNLPDIGPGPTGEFPPAPLPEALPQTESPMRLWVSNLSAMCGNQIFKLDGGEVTFNPLDNTWAIRKFHGITDLGDGPGPLDGANTRIYMPFIASGAGKFGDDEHSAVRIALDDGSASITPNHIHVNRINGMLTATPTGLSSSGVTGKCADGQLQAIVNLNWQPNPEGPPLALSYDGEIHVKQLDLHQLAMEYTTDPAIRQQAFGQLEINTKYNGSILKNSPSSGVDSVADRFNAQGDFDITHGYFLDIPVLRDLLIAMHSPTGSTVGEAAAVYDISHSVVNLNHTGASSPALGIQGSGTITFDQKVDMIFVATPLADWAKDVKGAGLLSDAGAAIIGKVQDVVNSAQRAVYQFRVNGDLAKPTVTAVPIPFLSDKLTPLFQKMAGGQKDGKLTDDLKNQEK